MATPTSTELVPITGHPGCFKFDVELLTSLPVMDWKQHFEMGRQAAAGEWKPEPDVPQVRAKLPAAELMTLAPISEIEKASDSQLMAIPDMTGMTIECNWPPTHEIVDAGEYSSTWVRMSVGLAQEILDTGVWDGLPTTQTQRQVAFDFLQTNAPGHRQMQLEEV